MAESQAGLRRRAILFVLASAAAFSLSAALVKVAAPEVPVFELMLFRSGVALLCLAPLVLRAGWAVFRLRNPWGHAARTVCGLGGMFGSFYGLAHLPLAAVTALGFAMPIFLAGLSVPLLGERVGPARMVGIAAGLLGVVLVVRPWAGAAGLPLFETAVVLAGVLAWAASMVSIRRLGQSGERNLTIVVVFTAACTVLCGVLAAPVWVWPRAELWPPLLAIGAVSGAAQLLMTEGYRSGEASMLAPFEYSAIVYTLGLGWAVWGEEPGLWEMTGIAVLVASGLFTWWREGREA